MHEVMRPKIHLARLEYDESGKIYVAGKEKILHSEKELIDFLAANQPSNRFGVNPYFVSQALGGILRASDSMTGWLQGERCSYFMNERTGMTCKLDRYIFWLDVPGRPAVDVRKYEKKVKELKTEYGCSQYLQSVFFGKYYYDESSWNREKKKYGQSPKTHRAWRYRSDAKYIHRFREACNPEYKEFSKPKDRRLQYVWPDEDFPKGRRSSGWKDNPGNKYRRQWEPKAKREFEKVKRDKEIPMLSPKRVTEEE